MLFNRSVFLGFALVGLSLGVRAEELKYTLREIPETNNLVQPNGVLVQDCNKSPEPGTLDGDTPQDPIEAEVDRIINIGKKIWAVIEMGRPVVNLKTDVGTALPAGVRCWLDLDSWQRPQSKLYEASFVNGYNMEVVKFTYRVIYLSGGGFEGVGKYVGYATMQPVDMQVAWGYRFDAEVSVPTVVNIGSKGHPVGGLQLIMTYKINTVMKHITQSQAYFIDGNGKLDIMN